MKYAAIWITMLLLPAALADPAEDTLHFYLSKSQTVLVGMFADEPAGGRMREAGVVIVTAQFKVEDVIKGKQELKGQTVFVVIHRGYSRPEDRHPLLKKDARCILFLNWQESGDPPYWVTSDLWFGIQHPFPDQIQSLKWRVEQDKGKTVEPRAGGEGKPAPQP